MKLLQTLKFAAIGTFAIGLAFSSGSVQAQVEDFDAGVPVTIDMTAEVSNTISATVTGPDLGNLGVIGSVSSVEAASLTVNPDGTFDRSNAEDGASRLVDDGTAAVGSIVIAAGDAFNSTPVYVTYENAVDLGCATCTGDLLILEIIDDLDTGATGGSCGTATATVLDPVTPANDEQGCAATAADGSLTINIGYTIGVQPGDDTTPVAYETDTYEGSFDAIVEY